MDRLTYKSQNDEHWYLKDGITVSGFDKLAAYENTGLTPQQVKLISNILQDVGETYNLRFEYVVKCVLESDYYKDIAQADKEGRLVVLPPYIPTSGKDVWLNYEEVKVALKEKGVDM